MLKKNQQKHYKKFQQVKLQENQKIIKIGFGYAGYIGSNSYKWNLENNNYHLKNESFYLIYSRQFKTWVFGIKFGKQNTADYNKKVLFYNSLGNPHYYFEKDANSYNTMVGGNIGYCLFDNFRITVGVDTFSKFTLGFTAGF